MTELLLQPQIQRIIAFSLFISAITAIFYFVKLLLEKRKAQKQIGFVMQIIPPKYSLEENITKQGVRFSLQRFFDNLTASIKDERISLEIYSDHNGIKFFIWTPTKQIQTLIKLNLYSTYRERIKVKTLNNDALRSFKSDYATMNEYKTKKHGVYMLMDVKDFEGMDPVQDLLTAITGMDDENKALIQLVIKPLTIDKQALQMAKENFRLLRSEITWISVFLSHFEVYLLYFVPLLPFAILKLASTLTKSLGGSKEFADPLRLLPDQDPRKIFVDKDNLQDFYSRMDEKYKTSFTTYIRVIATGSHQDQTLNAIEQALESMKSEMQNRLIRKNSRKFSDLKSRFIYPESKVFPFYKEIFTSQGSMSSREISMLYHLPNKILDPMIDHFVAPDVSAKKKFRSKHNIADLYLGINNHHERNYKVHLSNENRKRHIVITGQTGTGKSTILKNFVLQDIDNRLIKGDKRGLILMDPHEDFFIDILERLPANFNQSNHLIAWDTRSEDYFLGFNPLYAVGMTEREIDLVVDSNFKLIEKIIKRGNPQGGMGMTGKPMLINAMKTLMVFQNEWLKRQDYSDKATKFIKQNAPTLVDIKNLFYADEFEKSITDFIDLDEYEGLRSFWKDTLPNYKQSQSWAEIKQGFDNKISQILTGILLYTFGQSQTSISIENVIRKSKLLLVNLASKNIGEEGMGLLGSMLMSKVWFEAKRIEKAERQPFVVYADEFQNFATSDFSQALSEARKFKLELILAHQFFQQLPDDVFHSVMGNVKTKIYYRCGLEDAQMVAKDLQGKLLEQEVMEVPEFNANMKVGEDVFSLYVPQERDINHSTEAVNNFIQKSYEKYGKAKKDIEKEIAIRREWMRSGCKFEQ